MDVCSTRPVCRKVCIQRLGVFNIPVRHYASRYTTGVVKAFKRKEVSSRRFAGVFNKIIIYSAALIATHELVHFSVAHKSYPVFTWFDSVVFSAIIIRDVISIFENIAALDPNVLPAGLLKYLKRFDSFTGKSKFEDESHAS